MKVSMEREREREERLGYLLSMALTTPSIPGRRDSSCVFCLSSGCLRSSDFKFGMFLTLLSSSVLSGSPVVFDAEDDDDDAEDEHERTLSLSPQTVFPFPFPFKFVFAWWW